MTDDQIHRDLYLFHISYQTHQQSQQKFGVSKSYLSKNGKSYANTDRFDLFLVLKNDFEYQNLEILGCSVDNFGYHVFLISTVQWSKWYFSLNVKPKIQI